MQISFTIIYIYCTGPPLNVSVQASRLSIRVKWSPPVRNGDVDDLNVHEYYIEYRVQGSVNASWQVTVDMARERERDISNMQSNTTYLIRVLARSDIGNGSKSTPLAVTTLRKGVYNGICFISFSDLMCVIR